MTFTAPSPRFLWAAGLSLVLHGLAWAAIENLRLASPSGENSPMVLAIEVRPDISEQEPRADRSALAENSHSARQETPSAPLPLPHHANKSHRADRPSVPHLTEEAQPGPGTASISVPESHPDGSGGGGGVLATTAAGDEDHPARYQMGSAETPTPAYPMRARRKGHQGTVIVALEVSSAGLPLSVTVESSSGDESLDEAATETLKHWRLSPSLKAGRPVAGRVQVPIRFVLE